MMVSGPAGVRPLSEHSWLEISVTVARALMIIMALCLGPYFGGQLKDYLLRWYRGGSASVDADEEEDGVDGNGGPGEEGESQSAMDMLAGSDDLSPEDLGGETDRYRWTQTEKEVDVYVPVPAGTSRKDVSCKFTPSRLDLKVEGGGVTIQGAFFRKVDCEECVWMLEGVGENRTVTLNLVKVQRTEKNQHWKTVVQGDAEIDTSRFGPVVQAVDQDDPNSIKKMVAALREQQAAEREAEAELWEEEEEGRAKGNGCVVQ